MSSKYQEQRDNCNVICPYCKYEYQPEGETWSEDLREEECGECGKKYHLSQSFSVTHDTNPDCELNGQEHDFQSGALPGSRAEFCSICDKCRVPRDTQESSDDE